MWSASTTSQPAKVRHRAGHPQDAVVPAPAQSPDAGARRRAPAAPPGASRAWRRRAAGRELRVGTSLAEMCRVAGGRRPASRTPADDSPSPPAKRLGRRLLDRCSERSIRSASAPLIRLRYRRAAPGVHWHSGRSSPWPHGHGFEAAISRNRLGRLHRMADARDRDRAVLERLAQRLERRARELAELVEEEDAPVRQRHLAGAGRVAAADEPGGRDRVVRRPERPCCTAPAVGPPLPQALAIRRTSIASGSDERRHDRGQPAGGEALARAGRAEDQHPVAPGGGDLERVAKRRLAAEIGEVRVLDGGSHPGRGRGS